MTDISSYSRRALADASADHIRARQIADSDATIALLERRSGQPSTQVPEGADKKKKIDELKVQLERLKSQRAREQTTVAGPSMEKIVKITEKIRTLQVELDELQRPNTRQNEEKKGR
jgi:hypothetical protein